MFGQRHIDTQIVKDHLIAEQPEYTPPDGWRLLVIGEILQEGDEIVQMGDGHRYPTKRVGSVVGVNHFSEYLGGSVVVLSVYRNQRYIRPIE